MSSTSGDLPTVRSVSWVLGTSMAAVPAALAAAYVFSEPGATLAVILAMTAFVAACVAAFTFPLWLAVRPGN